jgi:hypothetical protein
LLVPSHHVVGLENLRFLAPMKYYRNEPRAAIVRARAVLGEHGLVRVHTTLSLVQTILGREPEVKLHFSGVVVLAPSALENQYVQAFNRTQPEIEREAIYRVFFHGPAFGDIDQRLVPPVRRAAMFRWSSRPAGKARRGRRLDVCNRGATQTAGMDRPRKRGRNFDWRH